MEQLTVLYGEGDKKASAALAAAFAKEGFRVTLAVGRNEFEQKLGSGAYDVAVLGHTLTRDDRHHLPYKIRKAHPQCRILVLHASAKHHEVDLCMDSRRGEAAVVEAVEQLSGRVVAA